MALNWRLIPFIATCTTYKKQDLIVWKKSPIILMYLWKRILIWYIGGYNFQIQFVGPKVILEISLFHFFRVIGNWKKICGCDKWLGVKILWLRIRNKLLIWHIFLYRYVTRWTTKYIHVMSTYVIKETTRYTCRQGRCEMSFGGNNTRIHVL